MNITALFTTAATVVDGVLTNSGTTVDLARNPKGTQDATVDPTTLDVTDPSPAATYRSSVPALLVPDQPVTVPLALDTQVIPRWRMLLPPDVVPAVGDTVTVRTCRDSRLSGRVLVVTEVGGDSAAAVRTVRVKEAR